MFVKGSSLTRLTLKYDHVLSTSVEISRSIWTDLDHFGYKCTRRKTRDQQKLNMDKMFNQYYYLII